MPDNDRPDDSFSRLHPDHEATDERQLDSRPRREVTPGSPLSKLDPRFRRPQSITEAEHVQAMKMLASGVGESELPINVQARSFRLPTGFDVSQQEVDGMRTNDTPVGQLIEAAYRRGVLHGIKLAVDVSHSVSREVTDGYARGITAKLTRLSQRSAAMRTDDIGHANYIETLKASY